MPMNCPHYPSLELDCQGCRYYSEDDTCRWYSPPLSLQEILTTNERLARLEDLLLPKKQRLKIDQPTEKPKLAGGVRL